MKTLKAEEVNGKAYATIDHARRDIGQFIDTVYNTQRLHSALGYKSPVEFEAERHHTTTLPKCGNLSVSLTSLCLTDGVHSTIHILLRRRAP